MTLQPELSIVLALRDAADDLDELLAAISRQTLARERYEVIVALAPSSDDSAAHLEDAQAAQDVDLVLENPEGYAASGLNRAIAAARAPFILRLDARSRPAVDYCAGALAILQRGELACVGGAMIAKGQGVVGRAFAAAMRGPFGTGGAAFRNPPTEARDVDTVYLGAWPRATLIDVGGFDESLRRNQDDELARRLRASGHRIQLDPNLRSTYRVRESIGALLRQYYRYGLEKPAALRGQFRQLALRQIAPPALVVTFTLVLVAMMQPIGRTFALPALFALTALHLSLGFFSTRPASLGQRVLAAPLLLGLHLAYGSGVLLGLPRLLFIAAPRPGLAARMQSSRLS